MTARAWRRRRPILVSAIGLALGLSGMQVAEADTGPRVASVSAVAEPVPVTLEPDLPPHTGFGKVLALDGGTLLVSSRDVSRDAARVYVVAGDTWVLQATLFPSDGGAGFGGDVALDGDTAVIGAPDATRGGVSGAGAAYVFVRSGSTWTQQAKLSPSVVEDGGNAGATVALQGDQAVVGIPGAGEDQSGAVAIFARTGRTWTEQALIEPPEGARRPDEFGGAIALDGDTLAVAPTEVLRRLDRRHGRAYVYVGSGASWILQGVLTAGPSVDSTDDTGFGYALDVDGDTIVVTAPFIDVAGKFMVGTAFVFERRNARWTESAQLLPAEPLSSEQMGLAVSLSGDDVALGAPMEYEPSESLEHGQVYLFHRRGDATWRQTHLLRPPNNPTGRERYGWSVGLDAAPSGEPTLAVGAPEPLAPNQDGAVYLYRR